MESRLDGRFAIIWLATTAALIAVAFALIWDASTYRVVSPHCELPPRARQLLHWALDVLLIAGGLTLAGLIFASGWRRAFGLCLVPLVFAIVAGFQVAGYTPPTCPGLFS